MVVYELPQLTFYCNEVHGHWTILSGSSNGAIVKKTGTLLTWCPIILLITHKKAVNAWWHSYKMIGMGR